MTEVPAVLLLELQLFGGVRLVVDGVPVTGRAVQRRRLALLALLARSPGRSVLRDRVAGVLWAEHAPDAARRLLNESIYVIRRELGADVLLTEGETVRLGQRVQCDADRFDEDLRLEAYEAAIRHYRGPLFGAWSVGDAPEFEHWAETERAGCARRFADAVPRAAALAARRGDWAVSLALFARLGQDDPDSVVAAEGEAEALARAGEPVQAIRRLDQFAARWTEDFGSPPPSSVAALRAAIVAGGVEGARIEHRVPIDPPARTSGSEAERTVPGLPVPEAAPPAAASRRARPRTWGMAALVLAGAAVAGAAVVWPRFEAPAPANAARIAIVSQTLATRDSGLAYLREAITTGVTNQLSGNRFAVTTPAEQRAVESGRISLDSLVALKAIGTIVELGFESRPSRLRITVRMLDATSREVITSSVYERPLAEALQLESDLVPFVADALRRRLRQRVLLRDTADAGRDPTARKLLITAARAREDASEVLRSNHRFDGDAARDMLLSADSLLRRAVQLEPRWQELVLERARVQMERARTLPEPRRRVVFDSAAALVTTVLADAPGNAAAYELRGRLRSRSALSLTGGAADTVMLRNADADLRQALLLEPNRAESWLALSDVQNVRGQSTASLVSARRAIEHDAFLLDGERAYFELFAGALTSRRLDEALDWCRRGHVVYPENDQLAVCELTLMRERPARPDDEARAWQLVGQIDSLFAAAERPLTSSYLPAYSVIVSAGVSARAGQVARARAAMTRARTLVAADSTMQLDLAFDEAWVHLMLGDRRRAVAGLRAVVAVRPLVARILSRAALYSEIVPDVLRDATSVRPTR